MSLFLQQEGLIASLDDSKDWRTKYSLFLTVLCLEGLFVNQRVSCFNRQSMNVQVMEKDPLPCESSHRSPRVMQQPKCPEMSFPCPWSMAQKNIFSLFSNRSTPSKRGICTSSATTSAKRPNESTSLETSSSSDDVDSIPCASSSSNEGNNSVLSIKSCNQLFRRK